MFDEQPDGDPHGECAAEIHRLEQQVAAQQARIAELREGIVKYLTNNDPEGFGCACEPNYTCGPCSASERQVVLREAISSTNDLSALTSIKAGYEARIEAIEEVIAENSVPMSDYLAKLLEGDNRSVHEGALHQRH